MAVVLRVLSISMLCATGAGAFRGPVVPRGGAKVNAQVDARLSFERRVVPKATFAVYAAEAAGLFNNMKVPHQPSVSQTSPDLSHAEQKAH